MVLRDADEHRQRLGQHYALGLHGGERARRPRLGVAARVPRQQHPRGVRRQSGRCAAAHADHGDERRLLLLSGSPEGLLLFGLGGDDTLTGSSIVDGLDGGAGKDKLDGADGADDLYGELGGDKLKGGAGEDYLDGGKGGDRLTGGDDADSLHGGRGHDTFILTTAAQSTPEVSDTILDFKQGKDVIDLHKIDDALRFIGEGHFTGYEGGNPLQILRAATPSSRAMSMATARPISPSR